MLIFKWCFASRCHRYSWSLQLTTPNGVCVDSVCTRRQILFPFPSPKHDSTTSMQGSSKFNCMIINTRLLLVDIPEFWRESVWNCHSLVTGSLIELSGWITLSSKNFKQVCFISTSNDSGTSIFVFCFVLFCFFLFGVVVISKTAILNNWEIAEARSEDFYAVVDVIMLNLPITST